MSTFTLARRACRLYRGEYVSKAIRRANQRKWIAAVERLGSRWLLAAPINKEPRHD